MRALGFSTFCPNEDKHGKPSNDFDFEVGTEELFHICPRCRSHDLVLDKHPHAKALNAYHCLDCKDNHSCNDGGCGGPP